VVLLLLAFFTQVQYLLSVSVYMQGSSSGFVLMLQLPVDEVIVMVIKNSWSLTALTLLAFPSNISRLRLSADAAVASGRGGSQGPQVQLLSGCDRLGPQAWSLTTLTLLAFLSTISRLRLSDDAAVASG